MLNAKKLVTIGRRGKMDALVVSKVEVKDDVDIVIAPYQQ